MRALPPLSPHPALPLESLPSLPFSCPDPRSGLLSSRGEDELQRIITLAKEFNAYRTEEKQMDTSLRYCTRLAV
jgi:hypothetical protein